MIADDGLFWVFLPHVFLMYFLPPAWPVIDATHVDWGRVMGKLAVCYPASLLYGWVVGTVWYLLVLFQRRVTKGNLP